MRICAIDDCNERHYGRGWCRKHWKRWYTHGDPLYLAPPPPVRLCSLPGCDRKHTGHGYCSSHLSRLRRHGDPEVVLRDHGRRWIDEDGYAHIGRKREHRMVMEQIIGRPLRREETVHHVNGVRDDNRPENLELWTSSHPSGQRVTDLIRWAKELLDLYGEMFEEVR